MVTPLAGGTAQGQIAVFDGTNWTATNNFNVIAPSSSGNYSGILVNATAGENVALGDICYIKSDGKLWKAKGDASSTMPGLAVSTGTISASATGLFLLNGTINDTSWSWTVGGAIYVSAATGGASTQTAPSTSGNQVQKIGYALSANVMYFSPNNTVFQV